MQVSRSERFEQVVSLPEILVRLTRKTYDDIHADEGIRHAAADRFDAVAESFRPVTSAHQAENTVRTALQRHVEMGLELGRRRAEADDVIGQKVRLDGRDAVAFDARHPVERREQVSEPLAGSPSEIACIDARYHDFLSTRSGDSLRFLHEVGDGHVAARSAGVMYRTVGALVVAAVLYLQECTCTFACGKSGEEVGQFSRVA